MIWTKSDIQQARKTDLAPLLIRRGYRLQPTLNGNFKILHSDDPPAPVGLVLKQSFWIWNEKNISGNAIDFFTKVENKSFHQAMQIISKSHHYDPSEQILQEDHGITPKNVR